MNRGFKILTFTFLVFANQTARAEISRTIKPTQPTDSTACPKAHAVGLKSINLSNGSSGLMWYPTLSRETVGTSLSGVSSSVARNGSAIACRKSPVIIFSHGFSGCSNQSVFLTESLARAGYVVIAPNHQDAICADPDATPTEPNPSFTDYQLWNEETVKYRHDDIKSALDDAIRGKFGVAIDRSKVAIIGHSLGGYSAIGMIGGYDQWFDSRFKAALLLSPYALPYEYQNRLGYLGTPVMFQGGTLDLGITPYITENGGIFDQSPAPKYLVELKKAGHFAWTNASCQKLKAKTTQQCLAKSRTARLIVAYSKAFLDLHLLQKEAPILSKQNRHLADYRAILE